jgi:hypothetical protein
METTNQKIVDKINTYFDNASYSELHSNDIWFTIIIFIVVIFVALYFFIISAIKSYKTSWQQDKCNPLLMPFASVINSEESKGKELDYIINNFNECLNTLNAELAQQEMEAKSHRYCQHQWGDSDHDGHLECQTCGLLKESWDESH